MLKDEVSARAKQGLIFMGFAVFGTEVLTSFVCLSALPTGLQNLA